MEDFYKKGLKAFRKFDMIDIGVFKTYLFTLGLLIGLCKKKVTKGLKVFTSIVAIGSGIYIMYQLFCKYWK